MEFVIIFALILINGVFAMSEIALISVRKANLQADIKKGSKSAATALKLSEEPDRFLSTIQIGITLVGIFTGIYSGETLLADFSAFLSKCGVPYPYYAAQGVIVVTITYFTLIFGELVPKRLGMAFSGTLAKVVAPLMHFLSLIGAPFVWILSKSTALIFKLSGLEMKQGTITEEEIKSMIQEGADVGEVQEVEQDIMERVFSLGDRNIESIMTHRNDIVWLDAGWNAEKVDEIVKNSTYRVYPVARGTLDAPIGVAYLGEILRALDKPDFSLEAISHPIHFFHENMKVYSALEDMKHKNIQYGVIYDEFGSIQGLVTLKDILSALLGYAPDYTSEPEIVERKGGGWLVDGQCSFYDFLEYFDMEDLYQENEYNTLSGLILDLLEHIPQTGEHLKWHGFSFEIVDMDGARIDKVLVSKSSDADLGASI